MKKILVILGLLFWFLPSGLLAQVPPQPQPPPRPPATEVIGGQTLETYGRRLLRWAIRLGALGTILMLVLGGFRYITSAGNPEVIAQAKARMGLALAGFLLLLLSVLLFENVLGIRLGITGNIPPTP